MESAKEGELTMNLSNLVDEVDALLNKELQYWKEFADPEKVKTVLGIVPEY